MLTAARVRPFLALNEKNVYSMKHFSHIEMNRNHTSTPAQAKEMLGLRVMYQRCSETSLVLQSFFRTSSR